MIKAICFDLDGVYFTEEGKRGFHRDLVNLVKSEETVSKILYKSKIMRDLCNGSIAPKDFRKEAKTQLGTSITLEEFAQMRIKHYQIDPEVKKLIDKLRKNGYKICTCTNNNPIRVNALDDRFDFKKDFDVFVSSHEVGAFKPDKKIFEILLEKLGVEANKLVYTDDNSDRLGGAQELGINTHLFDNLDGYIKYLKTLGVEV